MKQGRLRVFLGAAPGVGKTYAMLEQAHEWSRAGRDVVVGLVETHGRSATAALLHGLEQVPLRGVSHRGVLLEELDVAAVMERAPEVVLVDELAHTNAEGSVRSKRWQDVLDLLAAGIDVLSTVNVQHLESLSDVVAAITGVRQQETVPDDVVRQAERVELVDLDPEALRERLGAGQVYPPERIDAALSHYFRLGNLTGLRELALLWMADGVDAALREYRRRHGIGEQWPARERVVVSLTGGEEGETLLRRGARIAARTAGGELIAVHVATHDGLSVAQPEALGRQRELVERLGGSFHEVRGDDVASALVEFARANDATQLVLGASRRGPLRTALTGQGIGASVVREAGDIDVHLVNHAQAARRRGRASGLPGTGALSRKRTVAGFALAFLAGPLLTLGMRYLQGDEALVAHALTYQLLVVAVALVGGWWPALLTAVLSGFSLDFFFVDPLGTVSIAEPLHTLALGLYVLNGLLVSWVVDQAARRARVASRAAGESQLLAHVASGAMQGAGGVTEILQRTREALGADRVECLAPDGTRWVAQRDTEAVGGVGGVGRPVATADPVLVEPVGEQGSLRVWGGADAPADRRLVHAIAAQLAGAQETARLQREAVDSRVVAEADKVRTALLNAVGHDLRRPLAAAMTSLGALRSREIDLSQADRDELVDTAAEALATLSTLVTNLLDVSRLQAGVLGVVPVAVAPGDVALAALDELGVGPAEVRLVWPDGLGEVVADPGLLQRVLVNLLANALRYQPEGSPVLLAASAFGPSVQLRVIDTGPGVDEERRISMFQPFQRLGDTDNTTGLGLGLAVARGFAEGMGGSIEAEDTPGGGLTVVVSLPAARAVLSEGIAAAEGGTMNEEGKA